MRARGAGAAVLLAVLLRAALIALPGGSLSPWIVFALELASLLVLGLATIFGGILGAGFGSIVIVLLGIGLPVVGIGWVAEVALGREARNVFGLLSLLASGVGFCLAAPAHRDRFVGGVVLALAVFGLACGTKLLVEHFGATGGCAVAGPYLATAVITLALRPLRVLPATTSARPQKADR